MKFILLRKITQHNLLRLMFWQDEIDLVSAVTILQFIPLERVFSSHFEHNSVFNARLPAQASVPMQHKVHSFDRVFLDELDLILHHEVTMAAKHTGKHKNPRQASAKEYANGDAYGDKNNMYVYRVGTKPNIEHRVKKSIENRAQEKKAEKFDDPIDHFVLQLRMNALTIQYFFDGFLHRFPPRLVFSIIAYPP